jgi:hypothetical protein
VLRTRVKGRELPVEVAGVIALGSTSNATRKSSLLVLDMSLSSSEPWLLTFAKAEGCLRILSSMAEEEMIAWRPAGGSSEN